jgi:hypothetical protein
MAVVRPYFDPTVRFQGGSIFSSYLSAFTKERGEMNRQLMERALRQADPSFLQDQIMMINENILELQKSKAKALGGGGTNADMLRAVMPLVRIQMQAAKDQASLSTKQGGAAQQAMRVASNAVAKARDKYKDAVGSGNMSSEGFAEEVKVQMAEYGIDSDLERQALQLVLNEGGSSNPALNASGADVGIESLVDSKDAYFAAFGGAPGDVPSAKYYFQLAKKLAAGEQISDADLQLAMDEIDNQIADYKKQRTKLQEELAGMGDGPDVFAGFSGNYLLDNPFVQQGFQQNKVDALAYSVNQANRMEDRGLLREPLQEVEAGRREIASVGLKKPGETNEQYLARIAAARQRRGELYESQVQRGKTQQARQEARQARKEFGLGPGSIAVLGAQAAGQNIGQGVDDAGQFFMNMVDNSDVDAGGFDTPNTFGGPPSMTPQTPPLFEAGRERLRQMFVDRLSQQLLNQNTSAQDREEIQQELNAISQPSTRGTMGPIQDRARRALVNRLTQQLADTGLTDQQRLEVEQSLGFMIQDSTGAPISQGGFGGFAPGADRSLLTESLNDPPVIPIIEVDDDGRMIVTGVEERRGSRRNEPGNYVGSRVRTNVPR